MHMNTKCWLHCSCGLEFGRNMWKSKYSAAYYQPRR